MFISEKKIESSVKRLEGLKTAVLNKYLADIDLDDEIDLYNKIVVHLVNGDLDEDYISDVIKDMDLSSIKKLMKLVNEFISLCLYDGNIDNWTKSVDVVVSEDYDFILSNFLENYDFLVRIAHVGGRECLEEIDKFIDKKGYTNTSVIDKLRKVFYDDRALEWILLEKMQPDSLYNIFSENEMMSLLTYPEGTLYYYGSKFKDDDKYIKFISPLLLAIEIHNRMTTDKIELLKDNSNISDIVIQLNRYLRNEKHFDEVVQQMNQEYEEYRVNSHQFRPLNVVDILRENDNNNYWVIDKELLK